MIHGSPQPSQQKTVVEMGLSVKYLWRTLLFNGMNARRPTRFLKILHQQKQCHLDWKGRAGWNVRKRLGFQNSVGKNQAYETTQVQLCTNLQEKGKMTPKIESQATGYYFQALPYLALLDFEMSWAERLTPLPSIFSLS